MVSCKMLTVVCLFVVLLIMASEAKRKKPCGRYLYHGKVHCCYCMKRCTRGYKKCPNPRPECWTYGRKYKKYKCCFNKKNQCIYNGGG